MAELHMSYCYTKGVRGGGGVGGGGGVRMACEKSTRGGTPAGVHQLGRSRHPLPCGSGQLCN